MNLQNIMEKLELSNTLIPVSTIGVGKGDFYVEFFVGEEVFKLSFAFTAPRHTRDKCISIKLSRLAGKFRFEGVRATREFSIQELLEEVLAIPPKKLGLENSSDTPIEMVYVNLQQDWQKHSIDSGQDLAFIQMECGYDISDNHSICVVVDFYPPTEQETSCFNMEIYLKKKELKEELIEKSFTVPEIIFQLLKPIAGI